MSIERHQPNPIEEAGSSDENIDVSPEAIADLENETIELIDEIEIIAEDLSDPNLAEQLAQKYEDNNQLATKLRKVRVSFQELERRMVVYAVGSMGLVGLATVLTMAPDPDTIKRNGMALAFATAVNVVGNGLNSLKYHLQERGIESERDELDEEIEELQRTITKNNLAT